MLAARSRSVGLTVVTVALVGLVLPVLAAATSTGFVGSAPLYSRMRISGETAAVEKVTVTVFPADADAMFFAK
jgi:hypothetical protein